jgi:hypothetical protein
VAQSFLVQIVLFQVLIITPVILTALDRGRAGAASVSRAVLVTTTLSLGSLAVIAAALGR